MDIRIIIFISGILNLSLGYFVWRSDIASVRRRSYAIMAGLTGLWVLTNFLLQQYGGVVIFKFSLAIGPFVLLTIISWLIRIHRENFSKAYKWFFRTLLTLSILSAALVFYDNLSVVSVTSPTDVVFGQYFGFFAGYLGLLMLALLVQVIITYRGIEKDRRKQLKWAVIGLATFVVIALFFTVILPIFGNTSLAMLDTPSSLIFVFLTAYSIVSNNLFTTKLLATRFLITALTLILLSLAVFAPTIGGKIVNLFVAVITGYLGYLLNHSMSIEAKRQKEMEELIKEKTQANKKLAEMGKMKDEFFSIASHELRTPLTAIMGNSSMIEQYYRKDIKDKDLLSLIDDMKTAGKRLIDLVNDFLNVSRLEQGRIKIDISSFSIKGVIEGVVSDITPTVTNNVKLEIKPGVDTKVLADPDKTKEVLTNLIGNGLKYTEKGTVSVSWESADEYLRVRVVDTGIGIEEDKQIRLFQKFQQAGKNSITRDATKSSGLGLYISKLLTEKMGGKIGLESSTSGKGSIFYFELPLDKKSSIKNN